MCPAEIIISLNQVELYDFCLDGKQWAAVLTMSGEAALQMSGEESEALL